MSPAGVRSGRGAKAGATDPAARALTGAATGGAFAFVLGAGVLGMTMTTYVAPRGIVGQALLLWAGAALACAGLGAGAALAAPWTPRAWRVPLGVLLAAAVAGLFGGLGPDGRWATRGALAGVGLLLAAVLGLAALGLALARRGESRATRATLRLLHSLPVARGPDPLAFLRERRRRRVLARPCPPEWVEIVRRNFPLYHHLPGPERGRLMEHVRVFLAEKHFEGCGGLEVTDEVRVTVAAQACLLLLGQEAHCYPRLRSILVYPAPMLPRYVKAKVRDGLEEPPVPILGQSWNHGTVILSWRSTLEGALDHDDGRNLVLHELAHQLDQEDGQGDGTPYLPSYDAFLAWTQVMTDHHAAHAAAVERGLGTVLDPYGAENPAEFFAVATECFFEQPRRLRRRHPELYETLRGYYGQDPAAWRPGPGAGTPAA
jgi:Mlc titration factor MtfA (ptsG expression regulator)